jgi:hypothetical protein
MCMHVCDMGPSHFRLMQTNTHTLLTTYCTADTAASGLIATSLAIAVERAAVAQHSVGSTIHSKRSD